jgi:hypothetical protein
MNYFLLIAGLLLIGVVMLDALVTTLAVGGGGPISDRVAPLLWSVALGIHRQVGGFHLLLRSMGTLILLLTVGSWIVLLWTGWSMVFCAHASAVVDATTYAPASTWSRVYFTGYTLFTLGLGDYVPRGAGWEVATALASLNGLFLVTLSITYVLPVLSAAVYRHQLAAAISDLGDTPEEIVRRAWNGRDFEQLATPLAQLVPMIELHAHRHLAYPILHYFHAHEPRAAASLSLAALDEALLILRDGVAPRARLPEICVRPAQEAIGGLLTILHKRFVTPQSEAPPPATLGGLEEAEIPLATLHDFHEATERRRVRRAFLRAFIEDDGWTWDEVWKRRAGTTLPQ